jgi:two-component system, cell cycle response regulator
MTARVLVVDDILANVKLLQARLEAEYFEVLTASNGFEALEICAKTPVDIILLDVMMPGMDGFECCQRLKADVNTSHVPVVMVTALDQMADRVRGLEAGADDFLTKPINELAMLTRVRSLVRLKMMQDELRQRAMMSKTLGIRDPLAEVMTESGINGRCLLVEDRASSADRITQALRNHQILEIEKNPHNAIIRAAEGNYDLVIISMNLVDFDALRLVAQIRSLERIRNLPILLLSEPELEARVMRGLEMGVNDYIHRPLDKNELTARVRSQVRRKRTADKLKDRVQESMEMAVLDGLTGLHNRRYLETNAPVLVQQANMRLRPLCVMMLDIDFFKKVNDTYGHDAGDEVLREFANRIKQSVRNVDMACRMGGEEFIVVMPEAERDVAHATAERLRQAVENRPFAIYKGAQHIPVTVSIGFSQRMTAHDTIESILKRADEAVYEAKRTGRNRVIAA